MLKKKLFIGIIGFYVFWLCILPFLATNAVIFLCQKYTTDSNYELIVKQPKIKLHILPIIEARFDNITIIAKDKTFNNSIENLKIKIRLFPLLSGKFRINTLKIDNINLTINLEENFILDKDVLKKIKNIPLSIDDINIKSFNASFYEKDIEQPILYQGKDFIYQRKNRYVKFKNNSQLNIVGKISKVTSDLYLPKNNDIKKTVFNIEVENINISPLKSYFKHYLPKDLNKLEGVINIRASLDGVLIELINCFAIMQDNSKSIIFPEKLFIRSKFNITKNYIKFENIDIKSKNIHAIVEGKIFNYFGKTMPTLDLNICINKSKVEDIIGMLPTFRIEELDVFKLKEYKLFGDVLANFSIKGRLPEPDVFGDIYINNVRLISPFFENIKGAVIKLNFLGRSLHFDVIVPMNYLEKVYVKGNQELYNIKYANFTVKSTNAVDLKLAQKIVNPLHEILNFNIGPVPIMDLSGKGNIDILVKGNRKSPRIWGVFKINNGTASLNDISNIKATDLDVNLNFIDQNVAINKNKGFINGKDFSINGICNLLGKFDIDLVMINQSSKFLYESIKKSKFNSSLEKNLANITNISGETDLNIKLFGNIRDFKNILINKNIFAKGEVILKNNNLVVQNIEINDTNGNIIFETLNSNFDSKIDALIGNLPLNVKARNRFDNLDLDLNFPKLNPNFLISDLETRKKEYLPYISVIGKYSGKNSVIEYDKLNIKAKVLGSTPTSKIKYRSGGVISIGNNRLSVNNVKGFLNSDENIFDINLLINDIFTQKPDANGSLKIKTPDISLFNEILASDIFPDSVKNYIKDYELKKGALDLSVKLNNSKMSAYTDLAGISFVYLPFDMPIEIINGSIAVKNNMMKLNKINFLADNMPILIDGDIKDIFAKRNLNIYLSSKPQQEFIDKYINKNQIYPIKIKGDLVYWLKLKGSKDNYDLKAEIDISKNSSFYHYGATIGDIENAIEVLIDSKILEENTYKIKELSYNKIIDSQSGRQTRLNMLKAFGGVKVLKDDLIFNDLHIKTNHPTDARIFNIIFRKPNIKQGQFKSDLKLNGKLSDAKILGVFHIFETNIPFLDTTLKNIELVFKDKFIEFDSKGEVIGNDVVFNGILKNKLTAPYKIEQANLYTKDLDLNAIINKLKIVDVDSISSFDSLESFDLKSIIANDFKLKADNIKLRNIHATNFEALTSISEKKVFTVDDFKFNIAQGTLGGKYSYDLSTNDMSLNLNADSIDANDITWALFDLNNQIYGDLTGDINLSCNGADFNHCMQTLNGNTLFNVKDGKMPKLGSLEYLLKAGNIVKSGFTGLSINSIIDLIAPSKTGEFSDISGSIRIKDGIARNIEITTRGENLSLFIGGTYNFATSIADMEVFGLLSRKISNMLGPIGNVSMNTIFNVIPGIDLSKDSLIIERINKIPGIELSNKAFRKFIAEIKGNINGEDYVTSFKWIN